MPFTNLKFITTLSLAAFALLFLSQSCKRGGQAVNTDRDTSFTITQLRELLSNNDWFAPDTATLPQNDSGNLIRYGRELVANTGAYFGPSGKISHFANGMNCQNCHLDAGTKLYANNYSAVYSVYPKWRPRSGTVENLEKRINDCMERSLNGNKLDGAGKEMRAMVAYINWVGKDVKKGVTPKGAAVVDLPYLDRAAILRNGNLGYQKYCEECHNEYGEGQLNPDGTYKYPPVFGPHSFTTAAGLYRISRLAGFIKSNMPYLKATYYRPFLTDEQAWDIAAYINTMPRPEKAFKQDWPDISKKPIDHPFGPYADNFSEKEHKYGPYKEIVMAAKKK